jgi:septation ring formation regulator EzrA
MLDTKNQKATELASKNKDNESIRILKETIKIINKQLEELKINTEDADSPFAEISGKIAAIKDRITELKTEGNKKLTSLKERLNGAKELYSQGKFKEAAALITPKDGEDLSVLEHDIKYWLICFRGELHRKKWSLAIDCLAKIPLFSNSPFNADFAQMYDKLKRETISIDNIAEYQLLVILLLLHCKKVNTAIRAFQEITKSNEAHYVLIKNKIKALRPDLYPETE